MVAYTAGPVQDAHDARDVGDVRLVKVLANRRDEAHIKKTLNHAILVKLK